MSLKDKTCIVTGASRGIGRATVLRFTAQGANVIAAARTEEDLEETAKLAARHEGECVLFAADIANADEPKNLVAKCLSEFGQLDAVVNNAGAAFLHAIEDFPNDEFRLMNAININAVFYLTKAAWPALKESKGTIINVSSQAALDPFPGFAAYGASKAWVNLFTKALGEEGRKDGVKVFAVAPGAVETTMLRTAFPKFPTEQTLDSDDIAAMIELLLDDRCQYSSGQTVIVKK